MAQEKTTFERVQGILAEQLGVEENQVRLEATLADDLGADSLDVVEIAMALEEEFGFEISDEEGEGISTVQEVVALIEGKLS